MFPSVKKKTEFKSALKSTEELVTQARLNQIAKEHRSLGSILDKRTLYDIEDPKKIATAARLKSKDEEFTRRRAVDVNSQSVEKALDLFKADGNDVANILGEYNQEMKVWRAKCNEPSYFLKLEHYYPQLVKYRDTLSQAERIVYKKRITDTIIQLSNKYRAESLQLKLNMDLNSIFHPDANSHRVHCTYLMKLYKGIECTTIEEPILIAMLNEKIERAREEKLNEEKILVNNYHIFLYLNLNKNVYKFYLYS